MGRAAVNIHVQDFPSFGKDFHSFSYQVMHEYTLPLIKIIHK